MTYFAKYSAADLPALMERITRNGIGLEQYFERVEKIQDSVSNYPPYNHIEFENKEHKLELALAGFKRKEISVYTEGGRLYVEAKKEEKEKDVKLNYLHKGLALRNFTRFWTLPDDMKIKSVDFEDGLLTIVVEKIIPETHKRREYL
jgi:HSP20 family molecular chaperone IbpA